MLQMALLLLSVYDSQPNDYCLARSRVSSCTATTGNTLQHTALHCNMLPRISARFLSSSITSFSMKQTHPHCFLSRFVPCTTPQLHSKKTRSITVLHIYHDALMSCNMLQCVAVWCSVVQHITVRCSALQCVAVRCSVL